jgi:hypothetical protein
MALQSGGTISLRQVSNEFGGSDPIAMSEYYRNGAYVPNFVNIVSPYYFDRTTTGSYYYWQDAYWGFQRAVYWAGALITNNAGYNTTTITVGINTYYRGSYQTNQVLYSSSGFQVNYYWFSIARSNGTYSNSSIPTGGLIRMSNFYSTRKT